MPTKYNANKALVAFIAPVLSVILPFVTDGFQAADVGPIIVGVLIALGVYTVPNTPAASREAGPARGYVGD